MSPEEAEFVDRLGLFMEMLGGPRTMGRVYGWLLICDPAQQSLTELAKTLAEYVAEAELERDRLRVQRQRRARERTRTIFEHTLQVLRDAEASGVSPAVAADRLAEQLGVGEVWVKNDAANPTHSFKDRVVAVALAKALEGPPRQR